MLVDATTADRGLFERTFDACVIGTGPAGITIARKLAAAGHSVALMEGGALDVTPESQELYEGSVVGLQYDPLEVTRLRVFGGSSGHWGGHCRELDPMNFEARPHNPLAGWPISKADLDPFAAETDEILELPPTIGDQPLQQLNPRFRRVQFRKSPPVRFAERYHDEIAASRQILCAINANLIDLRLDDAGRGVITEAAFRSHAPDDPGFVVRARVYCLCLGGLETPRLLLNCDSQRPAGLGNEHDLVGRFFCEHPNHRLGEVFFTEPVAARDLEGEEFFAFAPTPEFLDRHEVLSFGLLVFPTIEEQLRLPKELARAATCATSATHALAARATGVEVDCDSGGLRNYFNQPGGRLATHGSIRVRAEQWVNPDSRVTLGDDRDAMGHRRIRFDWRLGELDHRTLRLAVLELGAHFAEQGTGRVRVIDWALEEQDAPPPRPVGEFHGARHHMCTTRMSRDPREGVVNANCRVHSVENLFIGGSSAFASPGYANPTYAIVQLSLRLGDHLSGFLAES